MLSIVAPVFNEEDLIEEFVARCLAVAKQIPDDVELVIVDDGSTDRTRDILESLLGSPVAVRLVFLSRNFGHQAALLEGLAESRGDTVVSLDSDLQDPPEFIVNLYSHMKRTGADVVSAKRMTRLGETRFKTFTASMFYRLFQSFSDSPKESVEGDFRIMTRQMVDALLRFSEGRPYIRGLVPWLGGEQRSLDYLREARTAGVTKFSLKEMSQFAMDAVIGFSQKPLMIAVWVSLISLTGSLLVTSWVAVSALRGETIMGWASTVGLMAFFSSMTYAILAILGFYIGQIHINSLSRPRVIVGKRLSNAVDPDSAR